MDVPCKEDWEAATRGPDTEFEIGKVMWQSPVIDVDATCEDSGGTCDRAASGHVHLSERFEVLVKADWEYR